LTYIFKKLIVGNLKMNLLSPQEREQYISSLKKEIKGKKLAETEVVICPPSIHLDGFRKAISQNVKLGAQNVFWEPKGSFTGEISPLMLKNFGCDYVIVGHSERRRYFCENNSEVNLKINAALKSGLRPIICVGETKLEKDTNQTLSVITKQVKEALADVGRTKTGQLIIAYEPVWAVGSDKVPSANDVMEAKVLVKKILVDLFGKKYAEAVKIIYGGSVSAKTARDVCVEPGMDGALIGRESLTPHEFLKIAEIING